MLPLKFLAISLMLVLPITVHGDLGMNITVSNLLTSVKGSIGQGVTPLVQANETIKLDLIRNDNGAIAALIDTVNKVVSPLNTFLESIIIAANSDGYTNSKVHFINLTNLANQVQQSLNESIRSARGMENKTNPVLYTQMVSNITELVDNVVSTKASFGTLFAAVEQVQHSTVLITSSNVSSIITSEIVTSLINPLNGISTNLNSIASLTTAVVMEKNSVNYYQNLYTSTFNAQQENYQNIYIISIERAIVDANNTVAGFSKGFETSVTQAYSPLMNQLQPESLANMTAFLNTVDNLTNDFTQKTNQSFTTLQQNITQTLINQSQTVVNKLYNSVNNLINIGFGSGSLYANQCVLYYGSQFSLSTVFIGRLSQCSVAESDSLVALTQTVRVLLDQVKTTAITSTRGITVCQQNPGNCNDLYFSAFPVLAQHTSAQLNTTANVVDEQVQIIMTRVNLCAAATTADINDYDRLIMNQFDSCLRTGN